MAVAATIGNEYTYRLDRRQLVRRIQLLVTGLASGANTIAHGLKTPSNPSVGAVPKEAIYVPTSFVVGHETSAPDATNLYWTVDSGPGTTISIWVTV